ncbi:hypothetical protein B0H10DRAFT_2223525 [Mycena sp. CBHHK59/15]|nr:hypothetical protein B0H10DRAFT_2223525 [Mycena sp. CBHHK59/15]
MSSLFPSARGTLERTTSTPAAPSAAWERNTTVHSGVVALALRQDCLGFYPRHRQSATGINSLPPGFPGASIAEPSHPLHTTLPFPGASKHSPPSPARRTPSRRPFTLAIPSSTPYARLCALSFAPDPSVLRKRAFSVFSSASGCAAVPNREVGCGKRKSLYLAGFPYKVAGKPRTHASNVSPTFFWGLGRSPGCDADTAPWLFVRQNYKSRYISFRLPLLLLAFLLAIFGYYYKVPWRGYPHIRVTVWVALRQLFINERDVAMALLLPHT